jgi:hypothetical protein
MATKRKQLEAQGWKFTPVMDVYQGKEYPKEWVVTPPSGHHACERRFEAYSDWDAVKWAFEQAKSKPLDSGLSGIAAIADLMNKARTTGVVAEVADTTPVTARPDGELISLCRDVMASERIAERERAFRPDVTLTDGMKWGDHPAIKASMRRLSEAHRLKQHSTEALTALQATTPDGVIAKARVIAMAEYVRSGRQALAQSLAKDVLAVLGATMKPSMAGGA